MQVLQKIDFRLGRTRSVSASHRQDKRVRGKVYLNHAQLALGQISKLNLLDGNSLARSPVEGLVDGTKGSLAEAFSQTLYRETGQLLRPSSMVSPPLNTSLLLSLSNESLEPGIRT